jgi:F-type H+-transporting ATPase subunit a
MSALTLDIDIAPSVLFFLGSFRVTTTFLLQVCMSILIIFIFVKVARGWKVVPSKFQLAVETLVGAALSQVDKVTQNDVKTRKIFPLVFTFFIFILISNLFTLLPGLGAISVMTSAGKTALFRSILADYSMVLMMTLITVILCQILFIIYNGFLKYLKKWFNFSSPLAFVLGLMDIIGEIAKVLSLSFRLFGNVFAGEVLMLVVTALVPFFVPFPFFALTLFSSVIQAFVFALLSAIFISSSMEIVD